MGVDTATFVLCVRNTYMAKVSQHCGLAGKLMCRLEFILVPVQQVLTSQEQSLGSSADLGRTATVPITANVIHQQFHHHSIIPLAQLLAMCSRESLFC